MAFLGHTEPDGRKADMRVSRAFGLQLLPRKSASARWIIVPVARHSCGGCLIFETASGLVSIRDPTLFLDSFFDLYCHFSARSLTRARGLARAAQTAAQASQRRVP